MEDTDRAAIEQLVLAGEPLSSELLIDCHCHMGLWPAFPVYEGSAEGMLRTMDRCGIDIACAAHHAGIGPDFVLGNDEVATACARFPGRFLAYCTLNGRYPENAITEEIENRLVRGSFSGIKLHPAFQQYPIASDSLKPAFELADHRGLPVLVHTWLNDSMATPDMFDRLATDFPNAPFILGHTGGTPEGAEQYLPVAKKHHNIHADLTGSLMDLGMIEALVREVGDERVLFGSDLPFIDCRPMLGYIAFSRISDESKRRILGLNAARLFNVSTRQGGAGK